MYFFLHPISSLNHLVARLFTDQIVLIASIVFFFYLGANFKSKHWKALDEKVANWSSKSNIELLKVRSNDFAVFGNAIFHITFSLIFAIIVFLAKHKPLLSVSILFTLVFSWGLNRLLKIIYKRERPEQVAENTEKRLSYCFPSGHVMASISIYFFSSVLLQSFMPFFPWYLISLVICSFVVLSRIFLNHHFFTDIIGGICMGIVALNISIWVYFLLGVL
jgi:membrane-associated phospholipid phosphatase